MSRAGVTPARIVGTAADLADADGLAAVTLSAVARVLGVRPPSLYAHVAGADELHAALTALALDELADRADRALAGLAGRDALAALAQVHRDYAREHPGRWAAAGALDRPVTDDLARAGARHHDQALAVLRAYAVAPAEQVHAVRLVASVLRGFVQLEAGGAFGHSDPPPDGSWERALDALDAALRTWPPVERSRDRR
ncbi:TetR/AcrR family transcriptional regulator [Nocardioides litoris]|uniref:TetR/AcrR family transcriptional regulator n=1 Tax=Nocardioides litoris TaxID=1926648 RepID=UPI001120C36A|nr:TetR-like C-terminal domain-containing protein [Nocardioides litoris]